MFAKFVLMKYLYFANNQFVKLKINIMKNLFLTGAMFMVFGSAVAIAQETPRKTNKMKSTTSDTISKKRSTRESNRSSSTYQSDTLQKQRTDRTNRSTTTNPTTSPTRRDSIGNTRP